MFHVGVLALQGGYAAHIAALASAGFKAGEVRTPEDLVGFDGVVLPGGESTTQIKLLKRYGLWNALDRYVRDGGPVLATCAGMILAATGVEAPAQESFGWLDIDVTRNGWGRQLHSGEAAADLESTRTHYGPTPLPLLFIRAPRIQRVGAQVEVLATLKGEPVLVRQGNITAATFHPELTTDLRLHRTAFGSL